MTNDDLHNENAQGADTAASYSEVDEGSFPISFVSSYPKGSHAKPAERVKKGHSKAKDAQADGGPQKPHASAKSIVSGVLLTLLGLIVVVYVVGIWFFSCHMMPKTTIASVDVSWMKTSDAQAALNEYYAKYTCTVSGEGFSCVIKASDISYKYDSASAVESALQTISQPLWFVEVFQEHVFEAQSTVTWSSDALTKLLSNQISVYNLTATKAQDAYLDYDDTTGEVKIQEAVAGTELDVTRLTSSLKAALLATSPTYNITTNDYVQPSLASDDVRLTKLIEQIHSISTADFALIVGEEGTDSEVEVARITPGVIFSWLDIDDKLDVSFSEKKMEEWIDDFIVEHSTVGTTRTYTRPDGKKITVTGGNYGWSFNRAEIVDAVYQAIMSNCTTKVALSCVQEADEWVAEEGDVDFGDTYIDVEVSTQKLRLVANGIIIHTCGVISGDIQNDNMATPYGVYYINNKLTDIYLTGDYPVPYSVHVDYWMSFVSNEIGIHDNMQRQQDQSRESFDNPPYLYALNGEGSHGCVNVSHESMEYLFQVCYVGLPVVVHWN